MISIFRREWKNHFCRLGGYLFLGILFALTGVFMWVYNFYYGYTGFEYPLAMLNVGLAAVLPIVTVPLFAEERNESVSRFLKMLPIRKRDVLWGKYLSVLALLLAVMVGMLLCPNLLHAFGEVDFLIAYSSVLAFFLLGWALLSMEIFVSLMIEHKILRWTVSYGVPVALLGLGYLANVLPDAIGNVVRYASLFGAYTPFMYGIFDWRSVSLWISVAAVFTVLTVRFSDRILDR